MARYLAAALVVSLTLIGWPGVSLAETPQPVPTARTVTSTAPSAPSAPSAPAGTVEQARRGVVVLERAGRPLGLGAVLEGDGRILTALSAVGNGNFVTARYHDGQQSPVKLVHSDRAWDLALLAPEKNDKKAGLRASKSPQLLNLQQFLLAGAPNAITTAPATLKPAPPWLGGDGHALPDAYQLETKAALLGAPIVDVAGEVVALVARACPPNSTAGCTPVPFGVPVPALKQFLRKIPVVATWLGIEAAADETSGVRGVRVVRVTPGSPAAGMGLRAGATAASADLIVAVSGTPVASAAELDEAIHGRPAGESAELLVFGMRRYRHVTVTPEPAPKPTPPSRVVAPKPGRPRTPNPYR